MSSPNLPDPQSIVDTAIGYMAAKQLFAASRVGLFHALSDGPKTSSDLADATGISTRNARILADAMASVGLLSRANGSYSLTAESDYYLGSSAKLDLAPFLHFLSSISFPHWFEYYDQTVDTGEPGKLDLDTDRWGEFMAGVQTYNSLHASMLTSLFDYSPHQRLLDFGGLSPAFTIGALGANPQLTATLMYAADFVEAVEEAISSAQLADRASVVAAPTESTVPTGSYDLILASHVIHRFDAQQNATIFENLRKAAAPNAKLMVLDFFLDSNPHQRAIDALHAGEYFVIDGTIVYPQDEVEVWLKAASWKPSNVIELPGSPRVLVADAI